jgi:hypothetical protein
MVGVNGAGAARTGTIPGGRAVVGRGGYRPEYLEAFRKKWPSVHHEAIG